MVPRFAYAYVMKDEPDRVRAVAPLHAAYWHDLELPGYLGGPFGDRSGGLITFEAEDGSVARRLVDQDPFVREALLESSWLREWTPPRP